MRICYLDHYAGSPSLGMEYRPHAMATHWQSLGHEVTLVAGTYSHLRQQNPENIRPGAETVIDGVPFRFVETRSYHGNGAARLLSMADFTGKVWLRARQIAEALKPDVVIASSTYPFDTWAAQRIAKLAHARLVHEVHDLWPLTPIELGGHSPNHPLMRFMAMAEKSAYRSSDVIVSILPNVEPYVRSLGISTPVVHVPNGIEPDEHQDPAPEPIVNLVDSLHASGFKVIGYAGGMATSNALEAFGDAMALIKDQPVAAVLIGNGELRPSLEQQASRNGSKVHFVGSVPKRQISDALRRMDALYIGATKSRLYEYGVSANKIFDYLLSGVPIVNAVATKHSALTYAECTIEAAPDSVEDITRAITEASKLPKDRAAALGAAGQAYVREHHDMAKLAQRFLDALA